MLDVIFPMQRLAALDNGFQPVRPLGDAVPAIAAALGVEAVVVGAQLGRVPTYEVLELLDDIRLHHQLRVRRELPSELHGPGRRRRLGASIQRGLLLVLYAHELVKRWRPGRGARREGPGESRL